MRFDLIDLRLFVVIAEERNLTRAAARQHLSLAAASSRIKALESQIAMPLLHRDARGVSLTPPGETFLLHARELLRQAEQLRTDLREYGAGLRGHLRVFANTTAVTDFLPDILPAFLAAHPQVSIDLQEKPNAVIARDVVDGRADLGIVAGRVDMLDLQSVHFSTDRLVLVTSRQHRFARRRRMSFADTLGEDLVGMHQSSTLQTFLATEADKLGRPMRPRIRLTSFDAMCRMIGNGAGIGIVPESAARRYQASMKLSLVELTDDWRVRERYILARDFARLSGNARALVEEIYTFYRHSGLNGAA